MELSTIITALHEHYADRSGEPTVSDYASQYGEPGYSSSGPVLLGNFWCNCAHGPDADEQNARALERGEKPHYLHGVEFHYPRTFARLEDEGCALEWNDEWVVVEDKAYRTQADSYSWEPTAVYVPDSGGEYLTPDSDPESWIDFAVNNPSRCIMSHTLSDSTLAEYGFAERTCELESGWYDRQDDPTAILEEIQSREDVDVLFKLSGTEQFRVTFCVFVRPREGTELKSRAAKVWRDRLELGTFSHAQCRAWAKVVYPLSIGQDVDARTSLTSGEAVALRAMMRERDGIELTREHAETGLAWIRKYHADAMPQWVLESFERFTFRGEAYNVAGWDANDYRRRPHYVPVWRIHGVNGEWLDYCAAAWQSGRTGPRILRQYDRATDSVYSRI